MMADEYEQRAFVPMLQKLIMTTQMKTDIHVKYEPESLPALSRDTKKALFLALQEGLTSGIRHGLATEFTLEVTAEGGVVRLVLANIGRKYEAGRIGFGLKTMMERVEQLNGTLRIDDNEGTGCRLIVQIPIETNLALDRFTKAEP